MPKSQIEAKSETLRRGFKSDAEKISARCRECLGLKDFQPMSSFALAKHYGIEVITPADIAGLQVNTLNTLLNVELSSHWSAVTIGILQPSLIIYNSTHSPARTESNIMHEMAHVLLEHSMGEIDTSLGIPLRKYDAIQEKEAEWLGACLQLPTPALKKYFVFGNFTPQQISELFNASTQMVRYRLSVSGANALKFRLKR